MDYTNAPATALVATHCALCGRALLDAASVESGMGPTCRARVLRDAPTEHRAEVNALVARIAANTSAADVAALVAQVAAHGYAALAERLTERLAEGRAVTVRAEGDVSRATWGALQTASVQQRQTAAGGSSVGMWVAGVVGVGALALFLATVAMDGKPAPKRNPRR